MSQIIIITGRVGKQPETKKFENGQLSNFSVAVSEKYTNRSGEKVETTEWFNCTISGKLSEVVEKWVNKGDLIQVVGKQRTRKYNDKDGVERTSVELVVDKLELLGGTKKEEQPKYETGLSGGGTARVPQPENNSPEEDDLPF
jgi:single-strand DNA-binding protein